MSPLKRPIDHKKHLYSVHITNEWSILQMKTIKTELVFILDRSGSMGGLESDTIGGFNSLLKKQQAEPGDCRITTVLFDDNYEILHDRIDIKAVKEITSQEYFVRGCTALLDAVGKTIKKISKVQKNTADDYRAEKVMFVITTDGMENASKEFTYDKIKSMVEKQKKKYNWEFIFLGANIDAIDVANRFGIARNRIQNFHNDSEGIALNYEVLNEAMMCFRASPVEACLPDNWGDKISTNFKKRKSS